MQPKTTVGAFYYSVLHVLLLHVSIVCGDPVSNSGKHEAKYRDGPDGDLRPGPQNDLRPGSDRWPLAAPICAEDEYYDVNVRACSRCSDICRPNIDITFCSNHCREYLRNHFDSSMHQMSSVVTLISSPGGVAREERLTEKPLFWTSIVSMAIAVAATAAIIVLCVRRRKPRMSPGGRTEPSEESFRARTLSETSDDKDPEQRTLLRNTSGDSARTTSCKDGGREYDDLGNQSTYIAGGGEGGGPTMDRFGGSGGVCHQNDLSNLPAKPSPDRYPSHQKVSQTYFMNMNSIDDDNNAKNVYENPVKINIWTSHKPNGKESNSIITSELESEKRRQVEEDEVPLWSFSSSSTLPTTYHSQETPYASLIHEANRAKEKRLLTYLGEDDDDETCVKQNRFVDLQSPTRLQRQCEGVSQEPKVMGILVNNTNSLVDIGRLQVSVRATTENDNQPHAGHCQKSKTMLCNSPSSPCDDGIASGINEPN